jgi:5'(3')-deoxyribonucleotidase|tara:strand:- start:881 stop:1471 length:591 start_codon:yes stop_codon:yes gene_type:complete
MGKKVILTDVDGVLLNWEKSFSKWMSDKGYSIEQQNEYAQSKRYGITKEQADELVKTFNESAWIRYLGALPYAEHMVEKFRVQNFEFKALTSLSSSKIAAHAREDNLTDLFQESIVECKCIETGADKDEELEKLAKIHPGAYWIEDKPVNAVLGLKFGLRPILITHPYNKDFKVPEGVIRANDWKDIFDIIHVFKR